MYCYLKYFFTCSRPGSPGCADRRSAGGPPSLPPRPPPDPHPHGRHLRGGLPRPRVLLRAREPAGHPGLPGGLRARGGHEHSGGADLRVRVHRAVGQGPPGLAPGALHGPGHPGHLRGRRRPPVAPPGILLRGLSPHPAGVQKRQKKSIIITFDIG